MNRNSPVRTVGIAAAFALIGFVLFQRLAPSPDKYLRQGQIAIDQKDYDLAVKCFDEAIQYESTRVGGYAGRAHALLMQKDHSGAARDSSAAIYLNPDLVDAYNTRSLAYLNQGNTSSAIRDATTAIEKKPDDADLFHNRGMVYRAALRKVQETFNPQEEDRLRNLMRDDFKKAGELDPRQYKDDLRAYGD